VVKTNDLHPAKQLVTGYNSMQSCDKISWRRSLRTQLLFVSIS